MPLSRFPLSFQFWHGLSQTLTIPHLLNTLLPVYSIASLIHRSAYFHFFACLLPSFSTLYNVCLHILFLPLLNRVIASLLRLRHTPAYLSLNEVCPSLQSNASCRVFWRVTIFLCSKFFICEVTACNSTISVFLYVVMLHCSLFPFPLDIDLPHCAVFQVHLHNFRQFFLWLNFHCHARPLSHPFGPNSRCRGGFHSFSTSQCYTASYAFHDHTDALSGIPHVIGLSCNTSSDSFIFFFHGANHVIRNNSGLFHSFSWNLLTS